MAKEIGTSALAVYLAIVCHADNHTQESFPSQQQIAEELGISRDTVGEKVVILEKANMIKVHQTKEEGTGKWLHNTYTLLDKSVWGKTPHGTHTGKNTPRVEANTVPGFSDTNYTHVLTKPIGEEPIVNMEDFKDKEWLEARAERKEKKKSGGGYSKGGGFNQPRDTRQSVKEYPKRGGVANGEDII